MKGLGLLLFFLGIISTSTVHGENCYIDGLEGDPEKKMHINNINCINELGHVAKYQGISKICKREEGWRHDCDNKNPIEDYDHNGKNLMPQFAMEATQVFTTLL